MGKIDGGELLIRMLEKAGINTIFTLHGGHLDAIYQAARERDFRFIDTRHEQAAAHAADGWARTTGEPGVCIVTAGPGVTDCVSGVANAFLDCAPILVIGGAAPLRDAETLPLQGGLDQLAMMTPITKWAHRISHTERIADLTAQALRIATTGRPGPVYLEIPIDVLFARVDEERARIPEIVKPAGVPAPTPESVETAIEWLHAAERPAILAGGGAWFSGAADALLAFAERTGVPVFSNGKAHGLIPADHPLSGRGFGTLAAASYSGAGAADVVLLLGARLGLFTRGGQLIPPDARLIQVDVDPGEIGRNRDVQLGIAADCRAALEAFDQAAAGRAWPERGAWQGVVQQARALHRQIFAEALGREKAPIHPYALADVLREAVGPEAIVVADGGETATWMEMVAEPGGGGRWLSHGYLGCLGTGLPFAIATQVAHPERRVVCIIGDGSIGLNLAEFDTMVRHNLPIVTVVNNDQQWGMSAHGQDLIYGEGRRMVTDLAATHYERAAEGLGCHAEYVEDPADLRPALERALASGRPACVNVMTDRSVISPITHAMVGGAAAQPAEGEKSGVQMPYYDDLE